MENFKSLLLEYINLKNNDFVLDIGCGEGIFLSKMAQMADITGFGTDTSSQIIEIAAKLNPNFNFVTADCENIPFDDNSMDIITLCAAYHHIPNINAFARTARRLIKEKSRIYIVKFYLPPVIRSLTGIFSSLSKDGDFKFYSSKEIINAFSNSGFRLKSKNMTGHVQILSFSTTE